MTKYYVRWVFLITLIALLVGCGSKGTPTPAQVMTLPTVGVSSGTPLFTQIAVTEEPNAAASQPVNCIPTEADGEGPFYKEGAPLKQKIEPEGIEGKRLIVQGTV